MAIPMKKDETAIEDATIEDVLIKGDLSALTSQQRTVYYKQVCNSLGLNPLTQPFAYITLNGKLVLYALRACADQLRKINGISLEIVSQDMSNGLLSIHVRAKDKTGRTDEDLGVVAVGHLKGEAASNAILKAVTKAKRRVTLSISGLGYLDETEIEYIPAAAKSQPPPAIAENVIEPQPVEVPHDEVTGEVLEPHEIALGDNTWVWFGSVLLESVKKAKSSDEAMQWLALNRTSLEEMATHAPKVHARLTKAIEEVLDLQ